MATILVVDDSSFQRKHLRKILEGLGHQVLEADDGNKGVAEACKSLPDLILSDLLMPEADGFTLLEKMRNRGGTIPVLVISSNVQSAARERCTELGAKGFISKPVRADVLSEALEEILA
jgi:CheY-like chemotaxis protein